MKKLEPAPQIENGFLWGLLESLTQEFSSINDDLSTKIPYDINQILDKIDHEYYYWDKIKYQKIQPDIANASENSNLELWQLVKTLRRLRYKKVKFTSIIFNLNFTNYLQQLLHEFDRNFGDTLANTKLKSSEIQKRHLRNSIIEESITSSQIEGAVTTRQVAKEMLQKKRSPRNKSEQMIANNYETIQHVLEIKNEKLTLERLLEIHELITYKTLDKPEEQGKLRATNDIHVVDAITGEVFHSPPNFELLTQFVEELCSFFNDENATFFIHPIVKASIIHFLIGYYHPFTDGNGRTARTLFYWYMLKRGYWLTEYLSISKIILSSRSQYYRAFQYVEADENDLTYFIHYHVKALQKAYAALIEYLNTNEEINLIKYQKLTGINERQAQILEWLEKNPNAVFTVKEIENRLVITNQTARTDLLGLVELGYLEKIQVNKKEQRFVNAARQVL